MSTTSEIVERLRKVSLYFWSGTSDPEYQRSDLPAEAAEKIDELERENAALRGALAEIAKQVPAKDMDEDYYEAADFEDGYDRCVFQARAALAGSGEK